MSKVAIFLANGFEEIEALVPKDIFERADIKTDLISISESYEVSGSHKIKVVANMILNEKFNLEDYDAIIFPGGMPGAINLAQNERLVNIVKEQFNRNKIIAAICASPAYILTEAGVLNGRKATAYPGMEGRMNAIYKEDNVVVDDIIITSRGPATSFEFAYTIVDMLRGNSKNIKKDMLYNLF